MENLLNILLMAPPQGEEGGGAVGSLIFILLLIVVFYFFLIRPQVRRTKEAKKFRETLKKGDRIITIGGIHGKIVDIEENTFIIEVYQNVKLKIEKTAVATAESGKFEPESK